MFLTWIVAFNTSLLINLKISTPDGTTLALGSTVLIRDENPGILNLLDPYPPLFTTDPDPTLYKSYSDYNGK